MSCRPYATLVTGCIYVLKLFISIVFGPLAAVAEYYLQIFPVIRQVQPSHFVAKTARTKSLMFTTTFPTWHICVCVDSPPNAMHSMKQPSLNMSSETGATICLQKAFPKLPSIPNWLPYYNYEAQLTPVCVEHSQKSTAQLLSLAHCWDASLTSNKVAGHGASLTSLPTSGKECSFSKKGADQGC